LRIAITHPYSWPEVRRGAERIIVETASALAGRGHDVTIITSGRVDVGRRVANGVTTVKLHRRYDGTDRHQLWFGARIAPLLLRGRFDAVHAMMPADALAAMVTGPIGRHRVLYEELGIPSVESWREPMPGHPPLKDRPIRHLVARHVDVYGCMSQFALDEYERTFVTGRGALVPGGVDLARFQPAKRSPTPTLLFSGLIDEPRKGVSILLEAVALLAEDVPDVRLWLSGPGDAGPLLAAAPAAARDRTDVLDLGDPLSQAARYAEAWTTVLPSTFESFGMVLVESLACGTPIVVADHSAPPELARPGVGFVTEVGDPGSLAAGLLSALTLARDPSTSARCRAAAADYGWDRLAGHLEVLYAKT
jgi:glycosyltransferase involved in cell wall biosynthesis